MNKFVKFFLRYYSAWSRKTSWSFPPWTGQYLASSPDLELGVPVHLHSPLEQGPGGANPSLLPAESFASSVTHGEPFPCTLSRAEHRKPRCRNLSPMPGFPKGCPSCFFARPMPHCIFAVLSLMSPENIMMNIYKKDLLLHTFRVITKDIWFSAFPSSCCSYIGEKTLFI